MNKASIHLMLADLFNWHLTSNTTGWAPINILHRVSTEGNVARSGRPGHRVLCREMSPDQRRTQMAYNSLPLDLQIVVCAKHVEIPLNEDNTPMYAKWGDIEKAHYLTESVGVFKNQYKRAIRHVQKSLSGG